MKLVRYGPKGQEKPGLLDAQGQVRDLSGVVADIAADDADAGRPGQAARHRPGRAAAGARNPAPRRRPGPACGKFICIGLNYADHAAESGMPVPDRAGRLHEDDQLRRSAPTTPSCCRRARSRPTGRSSSAS